MAPFTTEHRNIRRLEAEVTQARGRKKLTILNDLARELISSATDRAEPVVQQALALAQKLIRYQAHNRHLRYDPAHPELLAVKDRAFEEYLAEFIRAEINEGNLYVRTARYDQALTTLTRTLERSQYLDDRIALTRTYNLIAYVHLLCDRLAPALEYFHKSVEAAKSADYAQGEIQALINSGNILYKMGRDEEARTTLQRARAMGGVLGLKELEAFALLELGKVCWHTVGYLPEYIGMFLESSRLYEELGDKGRKTIALHSLGCCYMDTGEYDRALAILHQCKAEYASMGNTINEATTMINIGEIYRQLDNLGEALDSYSRSLAMLETIDADGKKAELRMNIGIVYLELKDLEKADRYLHLALATFARNNMRSFEAQTLLHLGRVALAAGRHAHALENCQRSREISLEIGQKHAGAIAQNRIGEILAFTGDFAAAESRYRASIAELKSNNDIMAHSAALVGLAGALGKQRRFTEAIALYRKALELEDTHPPRRRAAIHKELADVLRASGDIESAFQHFRIYHELESQQFDKDADMRLKSLRVKFDLEQAENERELLRVQNEILQRRVEEQERELNAKAIHIVGKNESLQKINAALGEALKKVRPQDQSILRDVQRQIAVIIGSETAWEPFEAHFRQVHREFYEALQARYPKLTASEMKVCVLLKLELSFKEISRILNVAPTTIEMYSYRIRKKLQLPRSIILRTFIAEFDAGS